MKRWTLLAAAFLACAGLVAGTSALAATPAPEKMEICHKTGSKKKTKFVKISVSVNALKAHAKHGDTFPAGPGGTTPVGSCPGTTPVGTVMGGQNPVVTQANKMEICHKTGSKRKPYVKITVSANALPAHARHGDTFPAAAGGSTPVGSCPGTTPVTAAGQTS